MKQEKKRKLVKEEYPEAGLMNQIKLPETDPQGSYTGRPVDADEIPVQDADDL